MWGEENDPAKMPSYYFPGSLRLDYKSAMRADVSKQNFTVRPRHWYVDAVFLCNRCEKEFYFTASEQKHWYEVLGFWIHSVAKNCLECRKLLRNTKSLRQEYDQSIAKILQTDDIDGKRKLAGIIDVLYESGLDLPEKINENRKMLAKQIAKAERSAA